MRLACTIDRGGSRRLDIRPARPADRFDGGETQKGDVARRRPHATCASPPEGSMRSSFEQPAGRLVADMIAGVTPLS
jgi:hypothetical protein